MTGDGERYDEEAYGEWLATCERCDSCGAPRYPGSADIEHDPTCDEATR